MVGGVVKVELEAEEYRLLVVAAEVERRSVNFQAAVLLRRALGLPDPVYDPTATNH